MLHSRTNDSSHCVNLSSRTQKPSLKKKNLLVYSGNKTVVSVIGWRECVYALLGRTAVRYGAAVKTFFAFASVPLLSSAFANCGHSKDYKDQAQH